MRGELVLRRLAPGLPPVTRLHTSRRLSLCILSNFSNFFIPSNFFILSIPSNFFILSIFPAFFALSVPIIEAPPLGPVRAPLEAPQVLLVVPQQHPHDLPVETPLAVPVLLINRHLHDHKAPLAYPNLLSELCRQDDQRVVPVRQHDVHFIAPARPQRLTDALVGPRRIRERLKRALKRGRAWR